MTMRAECAPNLLQVTRFERQLWGAHLRRSNGRSWPVLTLATAATSSI
jgi:hypothetical protein